MAKQYVQKDAELDNQEEDREAVVKPEPLPDLPAVLPFDFSYLPNALRGFVHDIAERMQCPPDFPAVVVFVMVATLIGRKVGIRPMRHNDWTVIVNLWALLIGNSGILKSPAQNAAARTHQKIASGCL